MKKKDIEHFKKKLVPIYEHMIKSVSTCPPTTKFCMQWGENFKANEGILFCGRANNGWTAYSNDANELFDERNPERAFNLDNQMQWMNEKYVDNGTEMGYRLSGSAFLRVLRKIGIELFGESWTSKTAWTNLYKIVPESGKTPSDSMCYKQLDDCINVFKKELEFLRPRAVVMLVGYNWAIDFLKALNDGNEPTSSDEESWDGYGSKAYNLFNTLFILSEHPQGKKEAPHVNAILNLIKRRSIG